MHIHTQSYTFIYPYTISAHFCFMYIHVYVRYTYACTHMHTTCIPCTHIYYVHICLYIHTNAPYSRNFFLVVKPCPRNVATQVSIPPWGVRAALVTLSHGVDLSHGKKSHDGEACLDLAKSHVFNCVYVCMHAAEPKGGQRTAQSSWCSSSTL